MGQAEVNVRPCETEAECQPIGAEYYIRPGKTYGSTVLVLGSIGTMSGVAP